VFRSHGSIMCHLAYTNEENYAKIYARRKNILSINAKRRGILRECSHLLLPSQSCFGAHREMICIETQYFNLNRILLLAMGLWPYRQSKLVRLQFIFFVSTLTSAIVFQVRQYYSYKRNNDILDIFNHLLLTYT